MPSHKNSSLYRLYLRVLESKIEEIDLEGSISEIDRGLKAFYLEDRSLKGYNR